MTRWKASGIHLAISLTIAALVGSLIYFVWYPNPYFRVWGGNSLMLLIMSVDIVLGPLLTLTVFRANKPGMKFDLAVISLLQASAFIYGINVIAQSRPVFIVAEVNRFTPVSASDLEDADLAKGSTEAYRSRSWTGPLLVGAEPPKSGDEQFALTNSALAGRDIDKFPKYYVPYSAVIDAALTKAHPLTSLRQKSPEATSIVDRFVAAHGGDPSAFVFVPLVGRTDDFALVISTTSKQPLDALAIDPW